MLTIFTAYNSTRLKMSKILPCALPGFIWPHTSTKKNEFMEIFDKNFRRFHRDSKHAEMDEGRKRVLLIAASILAAP